MKMAKPSEKDIDAAGDLLQLLLALDRGWYPTTEGQEDAPKFFDEHDPEHLRALYDRIMATLEKGPGYPGRVIGGMCYVIMFPSNEILDPAADTLELHPRLVEALHFQEAATTAARDVLAERQRQVGGFYQSESDDAHVLGELAAYAAAYAMPEAVRDWPAQETGYGATWGEAIIPEGWNPPRFHDRRDQLVRAGALILAEIERMDRAEKRRAA